LSVPTGWAAIDPEKMAATRAPDPFDGPGGGASGDEVLAPGHAPLFDRWPQGLRTALLTHFGQKVELAPGERPKT
jgi:hypothetical protein